MVPLISLPVPSSISTTAIASLISVLPIISSSAPLLSAFMPISSPSTAGRQSFSEYVMVNRQSSAAELVVSRPLPRRPVIAFPRELLARRNAKFAKLDEACFARADRILELESSVSTAVSTEAMLCFQNATPQTNLSPTRADLTTVCSSANLVVSALNEVWTNNDRLKSRVAEMSSTLSKMRLPLASVQTYISPKALDLLCDGRNRRLALLMCSMLLCTTMVFLKMFHFPFVWVVSCKHQWTLFLLSACSTSSSIFLPCVALLFYRRYSAHSVLAEQGVPPLPLNVLHLPHTCLISSLLSARTHWSRSSHTTPQLCSMIPQSWATSS